MKFRVLFISALIFLTSFIQPQSNQYDQKFRVWINSDLNTNYDPDDKVTLAQMLLLSDKFDIRGMVFLDSSWVVENVIPAYQEAYGNLSSKFDYPSPSSLNIYKASTPFKKFDPSKRVDIKKYHTLTKLIHEAKKEEIYLLNWGPMTEVAFLIKYLIDNNQTNIIDHITIVSHWTNDPQEWNYRGDKNAIEYLQVKSKEGIVKFYEIGPSGQDMVNKGTGHLDKKVVTSCPLGKIMKLKWSDETPDMSDGSTYLVLMGFGGGLKALTPNSSWDSNLTERLRSDRAKIFTLVEQRAKLASSGRLDYK